MFVEIFCVRTDRTDVNIVFFKSSLGMNVANLGQASNAVRSAKSAHDKSIWTLANTIVVDLLTFRLEFRSFNA